MTEVKTKFKRGVVVSDKMDKSVVVKVDSTKTHPIYKKRFISSKKFTADDQKNEFKIGDMVEIEETKPISKTKTYKVARKVK